MSQQIGFAAEKYARDYLVKQGLRWITSNYRCRWGEVDLIMKDANHLVFIEVRSRVSDAYGGAIESITYSKRQKILKTATHYMTVKNSYNTFSARFDVISIQGSAAKVEWIKNAFGVDF
jgi:putative endonuclease